MGVKHRLLYLGNGLLLVGGLMLFSSQPARSLDYDVDSNLCQQVKTRLKQVKLGDAVTRVNYGQVYESLSVNVMAPTNLRLVANNLKPVELLTITDKYQKQVVQFRQHYLDYEEKLSQVLDMSCSPQPRQLIASLSELRQLRQQLNADTKILQQLATDYQTKFKELYGKQTID